MRDFKPCDNVFPNEFFLHPHPEVCQWLSFNPLGEVICAYQKILLIPCCFGEKAHDVQSPLSKGPKAGQWVENSPRLMDIWRKSLALIALLCILLCFFLHIWPPVALCECPVGQGSTPGVATINSFIQFLQEQLHCFKVYA